MDDYISRLRKSILIGTVTTNDSFDARTHIKVLTKIGDEAISKYSPNLQVHVKAEVAMQIEDEEGVVTDVMCEYLILSVGSRAAKIVYDARVNECYIHFTLSAAPSWIRFYYGHMVTIFCPDIPMSNVILGAVFEGKDNDEEDTKPVERPKLTLVK